jgi:hypothetical protein
MRNKEINVLAYCDKIAVQIKGFLKEQSGHEGSLISDVGSVRWDLDGSGALVSTTKKLTVTDRFGSKYQITVEQVV